MSAGFSLQNDMKLCSIPFPFHMIGQKQVNTFVLMVIFCGYNVSIAIHDGRIVYLNAIEDVSYQTNCRKE